MISRTRTAVVLAFLCAFAFAASAQETAIPPEAAAGSVVTDETSVAAAEPEPANPEPALGPELMVEPEPGIEIVAPALPQLSDGTGAEGWYYLAKRIETEAQGSAETVTATALPDIGPEDESALLDAMYLLAFRFGERTAAKEAGREAFKRATVAGDSALAIMLAREWLDNFGADWDMRRALIDLLALSGDTAGAREALNALKTAHPVTARTNASEVAWLDISLRKASGDSSWIQSASGWLKVSTLDKWSAKILRLFPAESGTGADSVAPENMAIANMRASVYEKDYIGAKNAALAASATLFGENAPRAWISDAGKAFLYSNGAAEGAAFFARALAMPDDSSGSLPQFPDGVKTAEARWVTAFYLARLLSASGKKSDAGILYLDLTDPAPSSADADAALWYWLEIAMAQAAETSFDESMQPADDGGILSSPRRSLELAILAEASLHWKNATNFDDILDPYLRSLLTDKDWNDAVSLASLVAAKSSQATGARLEYLAGRLLETGLAPLPAEPMQNPESASVVESVRKDLAADFFRRVLDRKGAEEYYRSLASWRLGSDPPFLAAFPAADETASGATLPELSISANATPQPIPQPASILQPVSQPTSPAISQPISPTPGAPLSESAFIKAYLANDLDSLAASRAMASLGSATPSTLAALAREFSKEGLHNAALRLARDAVARGGSSADPDLYGLVYPIAWNDVVTEAAGKAGIPEALVYGIVRSESVFDPKAVSKSGAIGLTQLMPPTAAETAGKLGMSHYSLTDPTDNLRIGMSYYSTMLARFGSRPMRAMFAYNAGPSRMIRWAQESGELPDDILLETLHLSETRQYGKNIVQATLAYGKIHYGYDSSTLLGYLVEGKKFEWTKPEGTAAEATPITAETATASTGSAVATEPAPAPAAPAPAAPAVESAQPVGGRNVD
ncbi:MAG: transglycosylase SLT domain-containing protein [Rectinemataceae bacterium]